MLNEDDFLSEVEDSRKRLYNFARRHLSRPEDTDDVFSEAILIAWSQRSKFEAGTSFRGWIFKILLNKIYVANRRRRLDMKAARASNRDGVVPPTDPTSVDLEPFQNNLGKVLDECGDELRGALLKLNETEREAFLLLSLGGLSYAEIASVTSAPIGTVVTRLMRARAKLRASLKKGVSPVPYVRKGN